MSKVFVFLADGFEDVEALIPVDVLRRGGVDVTTVTINDTPAVTSAHGVTMMADALFEDVVDALPEADLLLLPGGMPGATNLDAHEGLKRALVNQFEQGKKVAAICAAPLVLGGLGLLRGKSATCYPGFEGTLEGANYTGELFTMDGNITTGEGPAAAFPFAYCLLEQLTDAQTAHDVAEGMRFVHLMSN